MLVLMRGAGDLATGVAARLHRCGFPIVLTELKQPTAVRRTVALSQAIYDGMTRVEDLTARRCESGLEVRAALDRKELPVVVDPDGTLVHAFQPDILVDAILAKRNLGTRITDAPLVIGLGPGFTAGEDCHCVVETMRGHTLGRCIYAGSALPNTGIPGAIGGYTTQRVLRTSAAGVFHPHREIGDQVTAGETVADVDGMPVLTEISGCLRGILPDGLRVSAGMKAGDVDPRCAREHCFTISDKALSIAGGVLEAVFHWAYGNDHGMLSRE